jgi:hypothetical protein
MNLMCGFKEDEGLNSYGLRPWLGDYHENNYYILF